MYPFAYLRPQSVEEAVRFRRDVDEAQWLAGGMTLLPSMKLRLTAPSVLIDLNFIENIQGIRVDSRTVSIGATTRHADVAKSPEIDSAIPALAFLAGGIGDPQVRNRGTIGGSISNNDPAADYPAAILGLNATIRTNAREIGSGEFFTGMFETCLGPDEIVTDIRFPVPDCAGYAKFPDPASGYAVVGVMVARFGKAVRVAVTGAGPCVFRLPELEEALARKFDPGMVESAAPDPDSLNSDLHASAEYRANLTKVMARRAIETAMIGKT